jgi:hypothetical protein
MRAWRVVGLLGVVVGLAMSAGACATVEPWQRARLANPCMVFDANGGQLTFDTHWLTAREGAAGGFGIQGGGCGCK